MVDLMLFEGIVVLMQKLRLSPSSWAVPGEDVFLSFCSSKYELLCYLDDGNMNLRIFGEECLRRLPM
jgi:hypothetical protein